MHIPPRSAQLSLDNYVSLVVGGAGENFLSIPHTKVSMTLSGVSVFTVQPPWSREPVHYYYNQLVVSPVDLRRC